MSRAFSISMEISFSFGLGFVQRSHKPLNLWGL